MNKYMKLFAGILISTFGIAMVIRSNLGAFPITCLNLGVSNSCGISLGTASLLVECGMLIFNIKFKEKVGVATIVNSLLAGYVLDFHLSYFPTSTNFFVSILLIIIGMIVLSIGFYFITDSAMGNTTSNGVMMVIHRITKLSLGTIRTIEEILFAILGFILGGPVGFATVILSLSFGSVMNIVYKMIGFDPDSIEHQFITFNKLGSVLNGRKGKVVYNDLHYRKSGKGQK